MSDHQRERTHSANGEQSACSSPSQRPKGRRPISSGKPSRSSAKRAKIRPPSPSRLSTGRGAKGPLATRMKRSDDCASPLKPLTFVFSRVGKVDHYADSRTAFIDIDRRTAPQLRPFYAVCRIVHVRPLWICYRRTTHGWHVIIRLRDRLERAELVAFQACCGSDPRREALNLMRVLGIRRNEITDPFWLKRWNILYAGKLPRARARGRAAS